MPVGSFSELRGVLEHPQHPPGHATVAVIYCLMYIVMDKDILCLQYFVVDLLLSMCSNVIMHLAKIKMCKKI